MQTIIDKKATFFANAIQHTESKLYFGKKISFRTAVCLLSILHLTDFLLLQVVSQLFVNNFIMEIFLM